jgi:hypothetical protein
MFTEDPIFEDATSHKDQYIYWGGDYYWGMGWRVYGNPSDVAFMDAVYGSNEGSKAWAMGSVGPDHFSVTPWPAVDRVTQCFCIYDPTNGTRSFGNILRSSLEANPTAK